jgi:cytochrome c oxidase subunit 1
MPLVYFLWAVGYGRPAGANPWGGTTLEWATPSPPPPDNFPVTPTFTGHPYEYRKEIEIVG